MSCGCTLKAVISTCQVAQIDIMNTIEHELSGDLKVAFRTVGESEVLVKQKCMHANNCIGV